MILNNINNKFLKNLISMKFAIILLAIISIILFLLSLFPQEKASLLYNSIWFNLLLFFVFVLTFLCVINYRLKFALLGYFLIHYGIIIVLVGVFIGNFFGFKKLVFLNSGESVSHIYYKNNIINLGFKIELEKFIIEKNETKIENFLKIIDKKSRKTKIYKIAKGDILNIKKTNIKILRFIPDFVLDSNGKILSRTNNWNNPAVQLEINGVKKWFFSKFPEFAEFHGNVLQEDIPFKIIYICKKTGGEIQQYKSYINIIDKNKKIKKVIMVNKPLTYKGITIYQYSYDSENLEKTGLLIKKDPGLFIVYLGFFILIIGIFIQLYKKLLRRV